VVAISPQKNSSPLAEEVVARTLRAGPRYVIRSTWYWVMRITIFSIWISGARAARHWRHGTRR
jgi:hypothetical protein